MDIIWTCLVTISACCWTVTHLNFPGTEGGWGLGSKMSSSVYAMVAPEFMCLLAIHELIAAVRFRNKTRKLG